VTSPKRTDSNQAEIIRDLRKAGYQVWDTHCLGAGYPDVNVLSKRNTVVLMEIKTKTGKLTDDEVEFHKLWPVAIVRSIDDALSVMAQEDEG
jgi:hypothetical protein